MIERKYSQPCIKQMNALELQTAVQLVLNRICIFTGWPVPVGKASIDLLVDELALYLLEKFPTINVNEIAAAFRQYSSEVNNWGKAVNIILIEQVLYPYMNARREASLLVELKPKEQPLLAMPEETPEEKIAFAYDHWKRTKTIELTVNVYKELRETGKMEKPGEELAAEIQSTVNARRLQLLTDDFQFFKEIDEKAWCNGLKQKLACHFYFSNLQDGKL